jgi:hypothetical protein
MFARVSGRSVVKSQLTSVLKVSPVMHDTHASVPAYEGRNDRANRQQDVRPLPMIEIRHQKELPEHTCHYGLIGNPDSLDSIPALKLADNPISTHDYKLIVNILGSPSVNQLLYIQPHPAGLFRAAQCINDNFQQVPPLAPATTPR